MPAAHLPGIKGPIITRGIPRSKAQRDFAKLHGKHIPKPGLSLDGAREMLVEAGLLGEDVDIAEFLEMLFDAVAAVQAGDGTSSLDVELENVMGNIMGMRPDADWWEDTVFFQEDYQGEHSAPGPTEAAPAHDLTGAGAIYPDDVYSGQAAQF